MGQPKDRGAVNCKINSITTTPLKHSSFNKNEQIWGYKISHMGQPKDRGAVNCKINSITTTPLKHSSFNENEQIWGYKICHMGQRRDRGCLNCKRNSIKISLLKHLYFNENEHFTRRKSNAFRQWKTSSNHVISKQSMENIMYLHFWTFTRARFFWVPTWPAMITQRTSKGGVQELAPRFWVRF